MLKAALSTAKDARTSLKILLLELQSTPITPNMSLPHEIMHKHTIQWPDKSSKPVNMEMVWDFLIAKMLTQKKHCDRSHSVKPLSTLNCGKEELFLSLANQLIYIHGTIIATVSTPRNYLIDAQDKQYHRSRKHIHPIQQDIFKVINLQSQKTQNPTHIPKQNPPCKAYSTFPSP